jgi:hypothetical protein
MKNYHSDYRIKQAVKNGKIDLDVHKRLEIVQEEYCFDIAYGNEGASLLVNSKEQMFTEKFTLPAQVWFVQHKI